MHRQLLLATAVLLTLSMAQAAEVYRWLDKDGKIHYSDTPPPPTAKDAKLKKLGTSSIDVDKLPYATRDAIKKNPVTLFANNCGLPCDDARQLLSKRGVPFASKNPETTPADAEALKKLTGSMEVPVLVVGSGNPVKGFEAGAWEAALDAAGYPKTALIAPQPKAKTPPPPAKPAAAPAENAEGGSAPPPTAPAPQQ